MARQPSVTVDINTRIMLPDEDIYVVRPGSDYSLHSDFVRRQAVFLDFPDLGLDPHQRPSKEWLKEAVIRSMELRDWHRRGRRFAEPSREQSHYKGKAHGRKIGRYVGALERLYFDLKPGTIVIVPGSGPYSDVRFGEIRGAGTNVGSVSLYPEESLPGRRVRWLAAKPKAMFSPKLRDLLGHSTPVMQLSRSLREEVLKAAFDQYVIGETFTARFKTTEEDFSTLDDYDIQTFVNYVSGVLLSADQGGTKTLTIHEAVNLLRKNREAVPELTSNINSPGALRLLSTKLTPITIGVLLAVALSGSSTEPPEEIHVINSAVSVADICAFEVQEQAMAAIKLMDLDSWHQICVAARDAQESTGFSTTISVVPDQAPA